MVTNYGSKMYVQLAASIDCTRFEQMSSNLKFQMLHTPDKTVFVEVKGINEAVSLCKQYIKVFDLGGASWDGGLIVDKDFEFIAKISYNGRVWDSLNWRTANEILC
jgi:hypothetical protein